MSDDRTLRVLFAIPSLTRGGEGLEQGGPEGVFTTLLQSLETRLDALVLRARFARTIYQARQVVAHRHITVNGKIVKSPSYQVKPSDTIAVKEGSRKLRSFNEGVLTTAHDANIGSIYGIGFPAWTGGAMQFINYVGVKKFVARANELAKKHGARFAPPKL